MIDMWTGMGGGGGATGGTTGGTGGVVIDGITKGPDGRSELAILPKFDLGTVAGGIVGDMAGIMPSAVDNPIIQQVLAWLASQAGSSVLRGLAERVGLIGQREDAPFCRSMMRVLQEQEPEIYQALSLAVCGAPAVGLGKRDQMVWLAIRMARNPRALEMIEGSECCSRACKV